MLAVALAASLNIVWAAEAQAATIVIPVSQWTYANSQNFNTTTTDSFVAAGDPSPAATVVRAGNDTTGNLYRGFMRFQLAPVVTGQIQSVSLVGRVDHTWACSPRPNYFYRTAAISASPRQAWPGPALQVPLGTVSLNANEAACAQPNMAFELSSATLFNDVQAAVNAQLPAYYIGVSARDFGGAGEANQDRLMRYFLNDFRLQIVFEPAA